MHILVVGCDGQLGVCLVRALSLTQWHVTALNKTALDISDNVRTSFCIQQYQPQVIINVAAYTAVDEAEGDALSAHTVNHHGIKNLAAAANNIGALLIHLSTDYVFDGSKKIAYVESDLTSPLNVYGQSKLAGEIALMAATSKYIIIRTSWLFGDGGNNFFTKIINLLKTKSELTVVNDQIGGPTYIGDLVNVIIAILQRYQKTIHQKKNFVDYGVYHYAGYPFVSWYEFACAINVLLLPESHCVIRPVVSNHYPAQAKRPLNSRLDSSKVQKIFGIAPSNWRDALNVIEHHNVKP
jgi:dTDP-4-dehydrorhamnose reductase